MFEQYVPHFEFITFPEEVKEVLLHYIKGQTPEEIIVSLDRGKKLALFGAGHLGINVVNVLKAKGLHIDYFVDNGHDKIGRFVEGIPIISVKELSKIATDTEIIITTLSYIEEILIQLHEQHLLNNVKGALLGWIPSTFNPSKVVGLGQSDNPSKIISDNESSIHRLFSILADEKSKEVLYGLLNYHLTQDHEYIFTISDDNRKMYFDKDVLNFSEDECFIDGGSLDGKNTEDFIQVVNGRFRKVILFEPNPNCSNLIKENNVLRKHANRIVVVQQGLYDTEASIGFECGGDLIASHINASSENVIETTCLDKYLNEDISFVKFDIEGAELPALKGGEQVIRQLKPKLAICVYHRPCDLWEIPLFVHDLCPQYNLYLRHYSNITIDTVLYATLSEE